MLKTNNNYNDNNDNVIVTIWWHIESRGIFNTLDTFKTLSNIMRHTEKPNIVRTVYSGILKNIQLHSGLLVHIQAK